MSEMIRREFYCDGGLVKQVSQVDVMGADAYHHYVDGRHIWLWRGEEVSESEAQGFIRAFEMGAGRKAAT